MFSAGFAEVIESHGGTILTNTEVEKIIVEGGAVKGVKLKGGEALSAPVVVSGGDIKRTYEDLVGRTAPGNVSRKRAESPEVIHTDHGVQSRLGHSASHIDPEHCGGNTEIIFLFPGPFGRHGPKARLSI